MFAEGFEDAGGIRRNLIAKGSFDPSLIVTRILEAPTDAGLKRHIALDDDRIFNAHMLTDFARDAGALIDACDDVYRRARDSRSFRNERDTIHGANVHAE